MTAYPVEARQLPAERRLRLTWSDGHVGEYRVRPSAWLVPLCDVPGPSRAGDHLSPTGAPVELRRIEPVGNYGLSFLWSDGHGTASTASRPAASSAPAWPAGRTAGAPEDLETMWMFLLAAAIAAPKPAPPAANPHVAIETSKGTIVASCTRTRRRSPSRTSSTTWTTSSTTARSSTASSPNFMIQGGGFDAGHASRRRPSAPIKNEAGNGLKNERGTLAMARTSDPDSATAQFFINVKDNDFLDRAQAHDGVGYAVFGKVIEGMDVVDAIAGVPTTSKGMFENMRHAGGGDRRASRSPSKGTRGRSASRPSARGTLPRRRGFTAGRTVPAGVQGPQRSDPPGRRGRCREGAVLARWRPRRSGCRWDGSGSARPQLASRGESVELVGVDGAEQRARR